MWGHNEMTLIIWVLCKGTLLTSAPCHQVLKDTSPGCKIFRQNVFLFFSVYLVETIKTHKISFMNEFPVAVLICLLMISHRVVKVSHLLQSASGNIEIHQELSQGNFTRTTIPVRVVKLSYTSMIARKLSKTIKSRQK